MKSVKRNVALVACVLAFSAFALGSGSSSSNTPNNSSNNTSNNTTNNTSSDSNPSTTPGGSNKAETTDVNVEFDESNYAAYNYTDIARKPDDYKGKMVVFSGTVIQVQESSFFGVKSVTLRINEDGDYDKTWYVKYPQNDSSEGRILDNDTVTVYGKCEGVETYTTVLGSSVTIPSITADKIALGKSVNGQVVQFNPEEVIAGLKTAEYSMANMFFNYYFLEVENPSEFDIDLTVNVKYYDESNSLIGVDSMSGIIQAGGIALLYDMPDSAFTSTQLDYEVKECSYSKPIQKEISYEVIQKPEKLIVTAKNNGEVSAQFVEAEVLFFSGDTLVDHSSAYLTDSDYELKPGKENIAEVDFTAYGQTYDNYKIYVAGRK